MNSNIVTRFAPSPTGLLHGGNYRTAIFAYLFAKKTEGKFIVRIEDTDRERSKKEYEENIWETLLWLNLLPDERFRQSEHAPRHQELLKKLIAEDKAYISKETPSEEGGRAEVIRFRNPKKVVVFEDLIRGPISIDTTDLGDFVIARSETEPVFHFAVVVDDADEGVTHVIRGEDHISNTPRQILIGEALGLPIPTYAHLPLVLGTDRTKLSKRRGAKALTQYRDEGYLPEAVINYLALLGWHPADEQEMFTVDELVKAFSVERIQKSAGVYDETKLLWFNHEHIKRLSDSEYAIRLNRDFLEKTGKSIPSKLVSVLRERYKTLKEASDAIATGEYDLIESVCPTIELLIKGAKVDPKIVKIHLEKVIEMLQTIPDSDEDFSAQKVKEVIYDYATKEGRAAVLWPVRVALSGREKSLDPFTLAGLLGKEKTIERLKEALAVLK